MRVSPGSRSDRRISVAAYFKPMHGDCVTLYRHGQGLRKSDTTAAALYALKRWYAFSPTANLKSTAISGRRSKTLIRKAQD